MHRHCHQRLLLAAPGRCWFAVHADLHQPGRRVQRRAAAAAGSGPAVRAVRRARHYWQRTFAWWRWRTSAPDRQQFAGEQDADPLNPTDCITGSNKDESVRAAELEVFGYDAQTTPPGDPVVAMVMKGDAIASPGDTVRYQMTYTNLGPKASSNAEIRVSKLPTGLRFVGSNTNVAWDSTTRSLLWRLGTVPVGVTNTVTLKTTVAKAAAPGRRAAHPGAVLRGVHLLTAGSGSDADRPVTRS
ncbi:MAG: hypothetical protein WKF73_11300 [Nocardioidaceae bacterium]